MSNKNKQMGAMEAMMSKPTISLSAKQIPELKKWKIGQEYDIELCVKLIGLNQYDDTLEGRFEIITSDEDKEEKEDDKK